MKKITFCTKSVSIAGGREKVLTDLANHLTALGFQIRILVYDDSLVPAFPLHKNVNVQSVSIRTANPSVNYLNKLRDLFRDVKNLKSSRHIFEEADIIIATDYLFSVLVYFSNKKLAVKLVAWEHSSYTLSLSRFWNKVRNYVYPKLKLVITLNKEEEIFFRHLGCRACNIPNIILPQAQMNLEHKKIIVWAGAFIERKGVDHLLMLAKKIKEQGLELEIHVYGNGELKGFITTGIKNHALEKILILKGIEPETKNIYHAAAMVIMTSNNECLPMVILEAFSFGVPVISFDCDTGPRHIIHDKEDGFLVSRGDVQTMLDRIELLLANEALRVETGKKAYLSSKNYLPEAVYPQWHAALA